MSRIHHKNPPVSKELSLSSLADRYSQYYSFNTLNCNKTIKCFSFLINVLYESVTVN